MALEKLKLIKHIKSIYDQMDHMAAFHNTNMLIYIYIYDRHTYVCMNIGTWMNG
jgi:hypothetical protein